MFEIFRLIRIRTLIFAAFTMYVVRYFVIRPILEINHFSLQMTNEGFTLLVVAVCCLVSAAHVINDYFDTKADRIAGIRDVVVGRSISRRVAMSLHTILNIVAVGIAFWLGFAVGVWKIGLLFLLISGILWFYSSTYKHYFVVGNLVAAIMAALVPVSVVVFEIPLLNMAYAEILIETNTNFLFLFNWIGGISWFIFLNILMYEINKDIYTIDGDRENGSQTFAVRLGIRNTKRIIIGLAVISILSLGGLYVMLFTESLLILMYFIVALFLPYIIYMNSIGGKTGKRVFQLRLIQLITLLCICACLLLKHFFSLVFEA